MKCVPPEEPSERPSLALAEARLMRAQAVAKIGSWELDLTTRTMWASSEAFRIYGLELTPDHQLPLATVQAMALPSYRPALDQALTSFLSGAEAFDVEYEIRRQSDAAIRHIHSLAELVRDASGSPQLVSGTIHDDTEIVAKDRAMMEALRASEERARMTFEQAADAIFLANTSGDFVTVNERALELTGYAREELVNANVRMLFSEGVLKRIPLRFDRLEAGETVITERLLSRKDGTEVPVEMHTKKLSDGSLLSIARDLRERKRLEEQLQLRQRMDSIGALTSGIAHDFNNILAGIMGYTCLLAESPTELDAAQTECVQNVLHATQRAADLVHSLRALSHPELAEVTSFDFFDLGSEVMRVLRSTTDRIIGKELRVKPGSCIVRGNSSNLYHALMNLGVNAIQAIERKSPSSEDRVTLDAETCNIGSDHALGLAPGRYVHVTVSDTGPGMSDEVRQHAFEPLFSTTTKHERSGQGLGLAMVYNIVVRQHGGAVRLETAIGQGCRVHLYLPSAEELPRVTPSLAPNTPRGHERILVVEDEPQLARLTRTVLERLGYAVLAAADGAEAIDLFERERDGIDLVLLDRTLPGLQGERVFEQLLELQPNLRVVITSGDASVSATSFPGAYCILQKPYLPTLLGSVIREALDARGPKMP